MEKNKAQAGKTRILYAELAYVLGIVFLALGTAFSEKADFGISMVVAPAYLCYLKISQILPWFSFGMAEYCLQALILIVAALVWRKWKISYFLSFLTAVFYGLVLDCMVAFVRLLTQCSPALFATFPMRILFYLLGLLFCALGVSFLFHTYFAPEAYEFLVKEIAGKTGKNINKIKMIYDCSSCAIAVLMSFFFFGFFRFEGVKLGTVICALVNGFLIGRFSKGIDHLFVCKDALPWRETRFFRD